LIRRALDRAGGNKRMAADLLHLKRTTLIEKLKRLERA
jgi:transcriptional regulator with PAS, ATPase and Fis domain